MGPCCIEELEEYFEKRPDYEDLSLFYINDQFPITKFVKPFMKATKMPLRQLSVMMKLNIFKLISGMIGAKRHKANYVSFINKS